MVNKNRGIFIQTAAAGAEGEDLLAGAGEEEEKAVLDGGDGQPESNRVSKGNYKKVIEFPGIYFFRERLRRLRIRTRGLGFDAGRGQGEDGAIKEAPKQTEDRLDILNKKCEKVC